MTRAIAGCLLQLLLIGAAGGAPEPDRAYLLGTEDLIVVTVADADEIPQQPVRIDSAGDVHIPLAGRVHAAGLSESQLEQELTRRLGRFIHEPQVTVRVAEYHGRPVSILGAVNSPGVHQLQGPKRLVEVLSLGGGLRPDAGSKLTITRMGEWGSLPLAQARTDVSGRYSVAELDVDTLLAGRDPAHNIPVRPNDVISVAKADIIYVIGEVKKAGGFTLRAREQLTLLKALSLAEGLERSAAPKRAHILRNDGEGRKSIPVNIAKILDNQAPDLPLEPDDVLVIPNNVPRSVALRTVETALQIGTGVLVFRR